MNATGATYYSVGCLVGFRVQGLRLGFRVQGLGFRVRVEVLGLGLSGVQGVGASQNEITL